MLLSKVSEIIRAVNIFLLKTKCPICSHENLIGIPISVAQCDECNFDFSNAVFDFDLSHKRNLASFEARLNRKRVSKKIVRTLYSIQNGCCAYCDRKLESYDVEHIIPLSVGGTNNFDNLVLSCRECNLIASSFYFSSINSKKLYILSKLKEKHG